MKLIKAETFKDVEYFGMTLTIRSNHHFIATDENGDVYSFRTAPIIRDNCWVANYSNTDYDLTATVDLEGMDFRDTLVEYTDASNV